MAAIDTRTVELGRYFTEVEDRHASDVCLIGDRAGRRNSSPAPNPLGKTIRAGGHGVHRRRHLREDRLRARPGPGQLHRDPAAHLSEAARPAQQPDAARQSRRAASRSSQRRRTKRGAILRARRHVAPGKDDDFFIGTARQLHLAVAEHQRGVLRRLRHDQLDLGRGGRHRHHERDAGQRHRADQGDRRPARGGRHAGATSCASSSPRA